MLNSETKRRIDSCRDILVGKVPDPKSQVEQITIALIYKFMDDMDAEAEELGGKRSFFAGEFAKYGWAKLLSPAVGGFEMIGLYSEAIARMGENPGVPALFRDIFKNAYLPYRDPETLRAFLKEINFFTYDHSEKLGDAFEYLLSVLGSQGDAGQFRTPRHIIDFIVSVVNPQKGEIVLDPACGTAGFLISSYKHILAANTKDRPGDLLSADERTRLAQQLIGYDISPDMVRLSLANLYLHGFLNPQVEEYDTLTSDDKWNEYADVILANPPFMSPKGGIKPHKRFSVQSNRSEVLFVDYIAEHLTPTGRAGVIVPEGIIFQSGGSYKTLREMLVKNYLVAVVSLPAGVFQPYSGVKTSVLVMDKRLAKASDSVLFVKIASDGFGLGAQRRAVATDDLPEAARLLAAWSDSLRDGTPFDAAGAANVQVVAKAKIGESGEYNLSGDRYASAQANLSSFPMTKLGEVIVGKPQYGSGASKEAFDGKVRYIRITDIDDDGRLKHKEIVSPSIIEPEYFLNQGDILIARSGSVGRCYMHKEAKGDFQYAGYLIRFHINKQLALPDFIFSVTKSPKYYDWIESIKKSGTISNINAQEYCTFPFPLPPLAVQHEIVAEIEGYQKIIDGARQVVENYKPRIDVRPEWPRVKLGEVCETSSGGTPLRNKPEYYEKGTIPWLKSGEVSQGYIRVAEEYITELGMKESSAKIFPTDTVLVAMYGATAGQVGLLKFASATNQAICGIFPSDKIVSEFLYYFLKSKTEYLITLSTGGGQPNISQGIIRNLEVPIPNLETQRAIVVEIEAEQKLVEASKELVGRFEAKIKAAIGRVWGEGEERPLRPNFGEPERGTGTERSAGFPLNPSPPNLGRRGRFSVHAGIPSPPAE